MDIIIGVICFYSINSKIFFYVYIINIEMYLIYSNIGYFKRIYVLIT